jgi:hypothetical protein
VQERKQPLFELQEKQIEMKATSTPNSGKTKSSPGTVDAAEARGLWSPRESGNRV